MVKYREKVTSGNLNILLQGKLCLSFNEQMPGDSTVKRIIQNIVGATIEIQNSVILQVVRVILLAVVIRSGYDSSFAFGLYTVEMSSQLNSPIDPKEDFIVCTSPDGEVCRCVGKWEK